MEKRMTSSPSGAEALLPCPFCNTERDDKRGGPLPFDYEDPDNRRWRVYCWTCGVDGPSGATEAEAIAAWNRRAPDPRGERIAALELWMAKHGAHSARCAYHGRGLGHCDCGLDALLAVGGRGHELADARRACRVLGASILPDNSILRMHESPVPVKQQPDILAASSPPEPRT